jgi:ATP-dependent Clp protease ATP-binding subunit ClpB
VDFKNTILILTSNLGSEFLLEGMGADGAITQDAQDAAWRLLRQSFRPEFLNRLDEIVFYKPLGKEQIAHIVDLLLGGLNRRLEAQNLRVVLTEEAKNFVIDAGYDPQYGARPLRRFLQHTVENLVSRRIVEGNSGDGDTFRITVSGDKDSLLIADNKIPT